MNWMNRTKLFPAGTNVKLELILIIGGYLVATGLSCTFFTNLGAHLQNYKTSFSYITSGTYQFPSCARMLNGVMLGYLVVIVAMLALMGIHYLSHYRDSHSIYLMRRLPQRGELAYRCTIVPLLMILLCVLSAAILTVLYYQYYMSHVPAAMRDANQWELLWSPQQIKWIWGGFHSGNVSF
jgi:hypothetical protein